MNNNINEPELTGEISIRVKKQSIRDAWAGAQVENRINILHGVFRKYDAETQYPSAVHNLLKAAKSKKTSGRTNLIHNELTPSHFRKREWVEKWHDVFGSVMQRDEKVGGEVLYFYFGIVAPQALGAFKQRVTEMIQNKGGNIQAFKGLSAGLKSVREIVSPDIYSLFAATLFFKNNQWLSKIKLSKVFGTVLNDWENYIAFDKKQASPTVDDGVEGEEEQVDISKGESSVQEDLATNEEISACFDRLSAALADSVNKLLQNGDAEGSGAKKIEQITTDLCREAERLNRELTALAKKSGLKNLSWSGLDAYKEAWLRAQTAVSEKSGRAREAREKLINALAEWLPRQNPQTGVRGRMLERQRELISRAADTLKRAATRDIDAEFPGQHNDSPEEWWRWQLAADGEQFDHIIFALRQPWDLDEFSQVVEGNLIAFDDRTDAKTADLPIQAPQPLTEKILTESSSPDVTDSGSVNDKADTVTIVESEESGQDVEDSPSSEVNADITSESVKVEPPLEPSDESSIESTNEPIDQSFPEPVSETHSENPAESVMDTPTGSVSEGMISGEDEATSIDGPADAEEALPENASDNEASGAGDFVWRMMKKDRLDLAYYWAKLAEDSGEPAVFPSSSAIRAIALANYLEENDEELHKEYEKHLSRSLSDFDVTSGEGGLGEARRLMALAASLIPLITRNSTNAEALVASSLNISGSPEVKRLIRIVKEFSECRFSIDLLRRGASNQAKKDRIENEFHNQAVSWLKEARSKKIIFDAGKKVWLVWLKSTGDIGRLVEGIIDNRRSEIDELRQIAQKWSQDKYIDKQIQDTDALLRKTGAKRRAITARSRVSLKKHVKEALKLFFKWELLSNFKVREKDFIKIPEYHVDLKKTLPLAKEWLAGKCEESIQNLALEVGYRLLRRTVDQLDTIIFHHENRAGFSSLPAGIDANLLRIPYIRLKNDAGCRPWLAVQPENFREALIAAGNDEDDWLTIAKMHMSSGNFGNAGLALELAENENLEEYDTIRASFEEKTVAARNNLYIRIKAARLKLNRAYCEGLLKEEEREQFDWPVKLAEVKDFHPINKSIAEMENLVAEKEREFTNQIREKINAMPDLSDDRRNRILQFLEKGRYLAAEGIVSGERYIEASYSTEEYDFYPDFIDRINSFTPTSKPPFDSKTFRKAAKQGKLGWQLPPENIEAALYNLDQFENLYRSGAKYKEKDASLKDRSVYLKTILTRIGFKNVDVQPFGKETDRRGAWYTMTCDTVNNRDVCPIPHFGSEADGKYSIYCVWDKPYGHELRDRVKKSTCPGRTIVIYLNWMDKDKRNDLAYQGGRSLPPDKAYIVLDCYLYLYICGQRNPLAALFNCAIMFSPGQPYQSTNNAGIPQEMFYGRTQQLDKICHRDGHLVYGGRQLGKTALLHAAQQRMHQPKEESYAFYLDLKNDSRTHIGTANQPSYIWTVMGKILFENGIISSGIARPDTFARCVMEWLDKNSKRRIFFFLDEADNFLEADRQSDWITVGELKNLMDKTTSRFKIVLAGLHNVQRTAKESNTPLAHFGDPICVGAFTDEVQAARDMINLPLRALGFRFEDPDLYLEILALTNYYPSLIQIFCRNLLDSLRRELSLKSSNVPPYTITHAHIQDAYNESIKHIRERFSWSLDLDPRYKFLAYMIAEELHLNPNGSNALTVGEIRTAALTIWDAGFGTQTGERDFSVLLDEMEGLGILRRVDNEMYTLRNRNVMALLGSPEGFEGGMLAAMDIEADTPYSPDIFRKKILKWSRNPLTESQELSLQDVVHGVIVIFGCSAAEVDKVPKALESSQSYEMRTLNWKNNATIHRFQEWVKDTTASQTKWTYLVVPAAVAWDMKWVKHAMNENRIGQSYRQRKVKIIFVGNSVQAWDWFINGNCVQGPNLRLMSLLPWHEQTLKQWFESLEIPFDRPKIRKTMGQCGGWGGLCDRFGEDVNRKNDRWDKHMNNDEEWTGADLFRDYFGLNFGTPEHEIFHLATEAFELFDDELDERGYYRTPVSYSEMKEWVSTMKPNLVDYLPKLWEWAAALSYIKRIDSEEDGDHWALNRILTRFAKAGAQ